MLVSEHAYYDPCKKNSLIFTGYDMSIFDAAFFKLLFDYVKSTGGPPFDTSPIESAIINNKQFVTVRYNNDH